MTDQTPPALPLSKFRKAGGFLFVSGQLPRGEGGQIVAGDIKVQTRQALSNLVAILEANGAGPKDVVKVTGWVTDLALVGAFNEVYREFFEPPYPARSVVASGLAAGADVEVEAIAYIGE